MFSENQLVMPYSLFVILTAVPVNAHITLTEVFAVCTFVLCRIVKLLADLRCFVWISLLPVLLGSTCDISYFFSVVSNISSFDALTLLVG